MKILATEQLIFCDVDETLILWGKIKKHHKAIAYTCPYTKAQLMVRVHEPNLAIVKERLARGATIIVWSASGWKKAAAITKALNLSHPKLIVTSKPVGYLDDKPCESWMGQQIYLDPDSHYGK